MELARGGTEVAAREQIGLAVLLPVFRASAKNAASNAAGPSSCGVHADPFQSPAAACRRHVPEAGTAARPSAASGTEVVKVFSSWRCDGPVSFSTVTASGVVALVSRSESTAPPPWIVST